jgi:hypothetical protein
LKNTKQGSPEPPAKTTEIALRKVAQPTVLDAQVTALEKRLVESEDGRKEERFLWFTVTGLLLVSFIFVGAGTAAGSFGALIYTAMLLVLSKRWGVEGVWEALYAARDLIGTKKEGDEG